MAATDRLFQNDLAVYNDIRPKAFGDLSSLVGDRDTNLPLDCETGLAEFVTQALLIDRFQQALPGITMNFDRKSDNPFGQISSEKHGLNSGAPRGPRPSSVLKMDKA